MSGMKVRFSEPSRGTLSSLEIAVAGRRSSLEAIQRLLFGLEIQIVRVESIVREPGLVERFQVAEFDGGPVAGRRAAVIRRAVRKAIRAMETAA